MFLYRNNLRFSQEMFTLVSCFEVTLRNRIDKQMIAQHGGDWLRDLLIFAKKGKHVYFCRVYSHRSLICQTGGVVF